MPTQHHVFLFRHCVRSTKDREKVHNNWTAFQLDEEQDFAPNDFVAEPGPFWNTPEYWCTKTGVDMMEATGRFLYNQLSSSSSSENYGTVGMPPPSSTAVLEIQIIADQSSQRDLDSALAVLRGMRNQSLSDSTTNDNNNIQVKGLDRIHFIPTLFHQWDDQIDMCHNKLKTSPEFQNRVRQEIQHRVNTIPPPAPGLLQTLAAIERLAGRATHGRVTEIPTLVEASKTGNYSSLINTSSPFPAMVSDKALRLAGPINIVRWFAETAFYSRAGGVTQPFLANATLTDVYQLIEWFDWYRTIVNLENSVVVSKGSIMARAILDGLTYGTVPYDSTEGGLACRSSDSGASENDPTTTTKVVLIFGHDSNMDAVASSLGLRWRLDSPLDQEAVSSSSSLAEENQTVGSESTPAPPGSAMHFVVDKEGTVAMDFWYPIFLEPSSSDRGETNTTWIPMGMQLNASGILERTPMILQTRSESIQTQRNAKLSADRKQTILFESGMQVLYSQLQATLDQFPDAKECYDAFLKQHSLPTIPAQDSCLEEALVKGTTTSSYTERSIEGIGVVVGILLATLLIVMGGYRYYCRQRVQTRGAAKVPTSELVSPEVPMELVAA